MFVYDCVFVVWNMWVENEFGHAEYMYRNCKKLHMCTIALFVILQRGIFYIIMTLACGRIVVLILKQELAISTSKPSFTLLTSYNIHTYNGYIDIFCLFMQFMPGSTERLKTSLLFFVKSVSFFLVADEFPAEEGRERE